MKTILVANPKGGSGKTTLSTNLAGYFAKLGQHVVLSDMDRQKSSTHWLARRPDNAPLIHGIDGRGKHADSLSADWTVIDSPAGLHGDKLSEAVKKVDMVVVPMQPSSFDIKATEQFLEILREEKAIRKERTFVAMVGMRVDSRTRSAQQLQHFLEQAGFPVITYLRDGQIYMQVAEQGLSLFDMRPSLVKKDLLQWSPLLNWLI